MASHHHLRHHPTAASYCCCCPPYSPCHHHNPSPPPPLNCHPLYHHHLSQTHFYSAQTHLPDSHQHHIRHRDRYFEEERENQDTIASLLRRIVALESALRGRSLSTSPLYSLRDAAARSIQSHFRAFLLRRSRTLRQLKDLASIKSALGTLKSSVTKQTHFDYNLIYHQAMELALKLDTIQGGDPMIRDGKRLVNRELAKFMGFLDGFFVEQLSSSSGVNLRYERSNSKTRAAVGERKTGTVKSGAVRTVAMEKLRGLVDRVDKIAEELDEDEESMVNEQPYAFVKKYCVSGSKTENLARKFHGVRPKVKKSVSFADDKKVYMILRRNSEPVLGEIDDDDDNDRVNSVSRDFEDDDVSREVQENGVSPKVTNVVVDDDDDGDEEDEVEARLEDNSDGEISPTNYLVNGGNLKSRIHNRGEKDSITLSSSHYSP